MLAATATGCLFLKPIPQGTTSCVSLTGAKRNFECSASL